MNNRRVIGITIFLLGFILLTFSIKYRKQLWAGVVWNGIKKEEPIKVTQETVNPIEIQTGKLTVEHRWHYIDKDCDKDEDTCTPSGTYQFRDEVNTLWLMTFCNDPPPNMVQGSIVDIRYTKADKCVSFINARVYKEGR